MRFLICILVVMIGCVSTLPERYDITADIAVEAARAAVLAKGDPAPPPAPAPAGDKCESCNGTGKVGDNARIVVDCPACGGTGRKPKSVCVNCK